MSSGRSAAAVAGSTDPALQSWELPTYVDQPVGLIEAKPAQAAVCQAEMTTLLAAQGWSDMLGSSAAALYARAITGHHPLMRFPGAPFPKAA